MESKNAEFLLGDGFRIRIPIRLNPAGLFYLENRISEFPAHFYSVVLNIDNLDSSLSSSFPFPFLIAAFTPLNLSYLPYYFKIIDNFPLFFYYFVIGIFIGSSLNFMGKDNICYTVCSALLSKLPLYRHSRNPE